ncbi:LAETG motif-containing sortase-dependent surface protein [Kitasatospora sp. NPDC001540]|uniref:LAETG motif-containing sortase-dependent surface protein n=1 Tax=Kitasatospora sp. NPDC001540 TaxID=3364014 RepID=UPI00367A835F
MSVRTRRARLASFAAVVVLGATVPVLTGASSAWACGDEPAAASAAGAPAARPSAAAAVPQGVSAGVLPMTESQVTAGGAPVEFGVEMLNPGPGVAQGVVPFLTFHNGAGNGTEGNLTPKDLVLQVMAHGEWKTVPLAYGCDVVLHADTSFLATDLDAVRATRFLFRLSVAKQFDAAQARVDVSLAAGRLSGGAPLGPVTNFALPIVHPAAPTASASATATKAPTSPAATPGTTAPSASVAPASPTARAAVPAAAVSSAVASPSAVPVAANLASTGGGSSSAPMLIGGTALVVLGAGAVVFARRRAAGARG